MAEENKSRGLRITSNAIRSRDRRKVKPRAAAQASNITMLALRASLPIIRQVSLQPASVYIHLSVTQSHPDELKSAIRLADSLLRLETFVFNKKKSFFFGACFACRMFNYQHGFRFVPASFTSRNLFSNPSNENSRKKTVLHRV